MGNFSLSVVLVRRKQAGGGRGREDATEQDWERNGGCLTAEFGEFDHVPPHIIRVYRINFWVGRNC